MNIEPEFKELRIDRPHVPYKHDSLDILNEAFRIGSSYPYDERTHKNIYFFMDPSTQEFVANSLPNDESERVEIKNKYLEILDEKFSDDSGYLKITEEIFGIDNNITFEGDGVRSEMTNRELKYKFLNSIPINKPYTLCVMIIDEIIPKILIVEPISD